MVLGFAGLISVMMIRVIFFQGFFHDFLNSRHGPCEDFLVNLHGFILYENNWQAMFVNLPRYQERTVKLETLEIKDDVLLQGAPDVEPAKPEKQPKEEEPKKEQTASRQSASSCRTKKPKVFLRRHTAKR